MTNHKFKDLKVWQSSIELAKLVYEITLSFPDSEKYGLISQIRRCAISIPSNISEGSGRNTNQDFARFLSIALGSSYELETQLLLSEKLKLINISSLDAILVRLYEVQKMLFVLQRKMEGKP